MEVPWAARLSRHCGAADGQKREKPSEDSPPAMLCAQPDENILQFAELAWYHITSYAILSDS